ncbi:MAG: hypothetical protein ACOYK9_03340 [Chlamydiia bacterium]
MFLIEKIRPWIWVGVLICGIHFFGNSLIKERRAESKISFSRIQQLNSSIRLAKERKEELSREIEAFCDPLWIEEVIKEELGMVRQSETKIVFHP